MDFKPAYGTDPGHNERLPHIARRVRARRLETGTQRLRFAIHPKPHEFTTIGPCIAIGYRRDTSAGTWVLRVTDGKGVTGPRPLASRHFADAGGNVLTWWQAVEKGLRLVRGTDDEAGRPATVAEVLTAYEQDLDTDGLSVPTPPAPANTCPLPYWPRASPC